MITAEFIKAQGNEFFKSGDYASAIAKYDEAHDMEPTNPTYQSNAAACWEKLGNYVMMEKAARKSLESDESFIKGYFRLAMALKHQHDFKGCMKALESGIAIESSNEYLTKLKNEVTKLVGEQVLTHINDAEEMLLNGDISGAYKRLETARQLDEHDSKVKSLMLKVKPKWEKLINEQNGKLDKESQTEDTTDVSTRTTTEKIEATHVLESAAYPPMSAKAPEPFTGVQMEETKEQAAFSFSPQHSKSNSSNMFTSDGGAPFQFGGNKKEPSKEPATFTFFPLKAQSNSNTFTSCDGVAPFQFGTNKKDPSKETASNSNMFTSDGVAPFQFGTNKKDPSKETASNSNMFTSDSSAPIRFGRRRKESSKEPATFTFFPLQAQSNSNMFTDSEGGAFQFGTQKASSKFMFSQSSDRKCSDEDNTFKINPRGEELFSKFTNELNERISNIKTRKKELAERHKSLVGRKNEILKKHGGSNVKGTDIIKLNVGGMKMYASRDTLTAVKGSRLDALFGGRWENMLLRDEEHRIFLDLDPFAFKLVLDYLQMHKISNGSHPATRSSEMGLELYPIYMEYFTLSLMTPTPEKKESKPCQDIQETISNEEDNLKQFSLQLDDLEAQILAEEKFAQYFICDKHKQDIDGIKSRVAATSINLNSIKANGPSVESLTDRQIGIINLIVDGKKVAVKKSTLCLYPDSKFAKLFTDDVAFQNYLVFEDGKPFFFLDMPWLVFNKIINEFRIWNSGMRDRGYLDLTKIDRLDANRIKLVTKYYLQDYLGVDITGAFKNSIILRTYGERSQVVKWLSEAGHESIPKLLYRASICYNKGRFQFIDYCRNKGPTITIVKTKENGYVFGGYCAHSWTDLYTRRRNSGYRVENVYESEWKNFLFSLKCYGSNDPQKYLCNGPNALFNDPNGPWFGDGPDIKIVNLSVKSKLSCYKREGIDEFHFLGDDLDHEIVDYEIYAV